MSEANKSLARDFFERLYSKGETNLIDDSLTDDYVAHGPGSAANTIESASAYAKGKEAVRVSLAGKPPDIKVTVERQVTENDLVVSQLRFSSDGDQWSGVAIQRVRDGKIAETWRIANRRGG